MLALNETSPFWFRKILRFTSYNLTEAADGMSGLSRLRDEDCLYKAISRHRVEKGLSLQLEFSDEQFEEIYKRWRPILKKTIMAATSLTPWRSYSLFMTSVIFIDNI